MSAGELRDAVARKITELPTVADQSIMVYANGSADSGIAEWPQELTDATHHCLVGRDASLRSGGTGNQRMDRLMRADFRFSGLARAEAERLIDALEDEIVSVFSDDLSLGGLALDSEYLGSDRPVSVLEDGRPWVVWVARFRARERFAVEMSISHAADS